MLSMGVVPPDSSIMTSNTGIASNPTPHGGCDGAEKNAKGRRREDIKARSRRETAIRRGSCGHGETRPLRGSLRHWSNGNGAGTARSFLVADMQQIYHLRSRRRGRMTQGGNNANFASHAA